MAVGLFFNRAYGCQAEIYRVAASTAIKSRGFSPICPGRQAYLLIRLPIRSNGQWVTAENVDLKYPLSDLGVVLTELIILMNMRCLFNPGDTVLQFFELLLSGF